MTRTSNLGRLVCLAGLSLVVAIGNLPRSASALDTPNSLMGVDGMVMNHAGLFRNATPNDGFGTFQFGPIQFAAGSLGRYNSFFFVKNAAGDGGISHNARINSNTPEHFNGSEFQTVAPLDLSSVYFPVIDRAVFGQRFDPDQYQIEVKFRPNLGVAGLPDNTAPLLTVGLDQQLGYVWDAEEGAYNRAAEQNVYNIGSPLDPDTGLPVDPDLAINTWYESAEKDADGFATFTVPVIEPAFSQRSFYHNFGDGPFRDANVVTGGGRTFNEETQVWEDVTVGYGENFSQFGGGPEDPNRPGSRLDVPNGVPLISFGAPNAEAGLSVEIKSIGLTKINPGPIAARIDANSGLTFRFGSGFTRGTAAEPIPIPDDPFGLGYIPIATDQISRFDESGMTNLFINMRTPDDPNEVHRFFLRGAPGPNTFDATDAVVNIRAQLTEPLTNPGIAQNLTIVAKDLDGNDMSAGEGADEYTYVLDLNQFDTSEMTTVSIPLADFTLSDHVPRTETEFGSGPGGFMFPGDESLEEFNLYEFGGLIPSAGGLLRMELEFMEIRLPSEGLDGDYNNNGTVDAADYVMWRNDPEAFGGPDGYNVWRANFGNTLGGGAGLGQAASVPEPTAITLAMLTACGLGLARRRLT